MKAATLLFSSIVISVCTFGQQMHLSLSRPVDYEFRGVWIATVDNIDWPAKGMVNVEDQKAEFIRQLEMHKANGMNAMIVQVRPSADAFYPSKYEPWSQWLTGVQGKAPSPYYDPLKFMIEETHRRGMEFHAGAIRIVPFQIGKSSLHPITLLRFIGVVLNLWRQNI
jgi:uncharacterized lipoprotein YddW (UPF0748 family)